MSTPLPAFLRATLASAGNRNIDAERFPTDLARELVAMLGALPFDEQNRLARAAAALTGAEPSDLANTIAAGFDASSPIPRDEVGAYLHDDCAQLGRCADAPSVGGVAHALHAALESEFGLDLGSPPSLGYVERLIAHAIATALLARRPMASIAAAHVPTIQGYDVVRPLAVAGTATIVLARDPSGRACAVRVDPEGEIDHSEIVRDGAASHARLAALLAGGIALDGSSRWIASEHVHGVALRDVLDAGRLDTETALLVARQILEGLAELHRRGIIHDDLTPETVLLDLDNPGVKLVDYAWTGRRDTMDAPPRPVPGPVQGAPSYLSPEQARGAPRHPHTDVWAFGVVLYEMLAGELPFAGRTIMEVGAAILTSEARLDRTEIPACVRGFMKTCLERDGAKRWADGGAALAAFDACVKAELARLRYERQHAHWYRVVEERLVFAFAAEHAGVWSDGRVAECAAFLANRGIEPLDPEKLAAILPPVFAAQRDLCQAEETAATELHALGDEVVALTPEARRIRLKDVERAVQDIADQRDELERAVERAMVEVIQDWEEHKAELARQEQARRDELARLERERQAELARAAELARQAEQARLAREAELRAEVERKRQLALAAKQREHQREKIIIAVMVGALFVFILWARC